MMNYLFDLKCNLIPQAYHKFPFDATKSSNILSSRVSKFDAELNVLTPGYFLKMREDDISFKDN